MPQTVRDQFSKWLIVTLAGVLFSYLIIAYLCLPLYWRIYTKTHPSFENVPRITHTANGIPGDPLNVALVGSEDEVKRLLLAAGWFPADPLTLRSCLKIAEDTVLGHPYAEAPVSNLFLDHKKEDLAFEQPVGDNPRQRHHVRFWLLRQDYHGRPLWMGAAIYDQHVGLSRETLQITHHTAPDIDTERDKLFNDLQKTGMLQEFFVVTGFQPILQGRNGGGDPWHTDGNLEVGVIAPGNVVSQK